VFRGNGWDGIDAHWRAKHEDTMPYERFWNSLCECHGGLPDAARTRVLYSKYMKDQNVAGSGRAASYVRALDLLGPILAKSKFQNCSDIWSIDSVQKVARLYDYVLEQQRLGAKGIFGGEEPVSYWRDGYCSAALKSYKKFLILYPHEQSLWNTLAQTDIDPAELSAQLDAQEICSAEELIDDCEVDLSTRIGREKLREVKTRVNQDRFRKLLLFTYRSECCVTGLNIPDVLRASHIVGWAEDEKNRMNLANGLCLAATYDAAFDRHLISFDEECRMIFSPSLKEYYSNEAFKTQFQVFEGQAIRKPRRFEPDQAFLEKHRAKMPT
jgi:putative restriction endonuclease